MAIDRLRSGVWLLIGMTGNSPGVLELTDGSIRFTDADGQRVFEAPVGDVSATFPWYYFGGGCKIRVKATGVTHRISFVKPNGAGDAADLFIVGEKFGDIARGRTAGKEWKAALAGRTA
jgi:hypothetical protein